MLLLRINPKVEELAKFASEILGGNLVESTYVVCAYNGNSLNFIEKFSSLMNGIDFSTF
jgi:hypothetical protein